MPLITITTIILIIFAVLLGLGFTKFAQGRENYFLILSFVAALLMLLYCLQWALGVNKFAFASTIIWGFITFRCYARANHAKVIQKQEQGSPPQE
jgi:predicted cation transporter